MPELGSTPQFVPVAVPLPAPPAPDVPAFDAPASSESKALPNCKHAGSEPNTSIQISRRIAAILARAAPPRPNFRRFLGRLPRFWSRATTARESQAHGGGELKISSGVLERAVARPGLIGALEVQQISGELRGEVMRDPLRVEHHQAELIALGTLHLVVPTQVHARADSAELPLIEGHNQRPKLCREHRLQRQIERHDGREALQPPRSAQPLIGFRDVTRLRLARTATDRERSRQ